MFKTESRLYVPIKVFAYTAFPGQSFFTSFEGERALLAYKKHVRKVL